jgi:hypothetical protein
VDDPAAERDAKKARRGGRTAGGLPQQVPTEEKLSTRKRYNSVINRILTPAFKGQARVRHHDAHGRRPCDARRAHVSADANNAMRPLSKLRSFAIGEGMRPGQDQSCKGIERYKNCERERWLDEKELPLYVATLAKAPIDAVHGSVAISSPSLAGECPTRGYWTRPGQSERARSLP